MDELRVGIIGASATRGWARISHVPAVHGLSGLSLHAVAGSDQANADAAARAHGAARAYGSASALIADPAVDIVTIGVRVPEHLGLVTEALAAGKHVYCEWPLGRTVGEAETMARAAAASDRRVAIGLQARCNPAVRRAAAMIAEGRLGRPLGARLFSSTMAFGPHVEAAMAFAEDPAAAVNLVTIQAMHSLDLANALLGGFACVDVTLDRQYPHVEIEGEAAVRDRTIFDRVVASARFGEGRLLAADIAGGYPVDHTPFLLEIRGEKGTLALGGGAPRGFQSGTLTLTVDDEPVVVDEGELAGLPVEAVNVAGVYAALRDNVRHGTRDAPSFDHAVRLTRFVDALLLSGASGSAVDADGWPA